jgi:hypothetical protein
MQRLLIALFILIPVAVSAAPLSDKDKMAFAGEWRATGQGCGPGKGEARFTVEFAVTGGQVFIDDPGAMRLMLGVKSTDASDDTLTLNFDTGSAWTFQRTGAGTLVSQSPPQSFAGLKGLTFRRCRAPADRSALKVDSEAIDFFSVMMPPDYPTFIDAHEKDGCLAKTYHYVSIDLVGPEEFAITRGSLRAVARPAKDAPPVEPYDVTTWSIDAAEELPNVVRLTITPRGGGPSTKISLVAGEDASLLTIPEWDAVYRRCTIRDLAPG